ncbi:A/G-specific adenine glycosylase [bacterium]|nr:A/G-specific adenine glycosylase [bacterium]
MVIDPTLKKCIQKNILSWYQANKRDMPWRNTKDPYGIWVSEIMLQQTQVSTVIAYYKRFIAEFPTVRHLANAQLDRVMKLWEGLGYYGRARNLHRAAQEIMSRFGGRIPDHEKDLLSLPGIGRYTVGAILSIAFGKGVSVLDGNIIRLLSRIFHVTDSVDHAETKNQLWSLSEQIIPENGIQDFNQGLMELGAIVCKLKNPLCADCPLDKVCEANRLSIQTELPVRSPKKKIPHYDVTAGIIWRKGKFLITLRPPKGLLGGLWEFPGGKQKAGESLKDCLQREIREELNVDIKVDNLLVSVKHAYTHFRITLHVFNCQYVGGKIRLHGCDDYLWITSAELDDFALPGADRKVIKLLTRNKNDSPIEVEPLRE